MDKNIYTEIKQALSFLKKVKGADRQDNKCLNIATNHLHHALNRFDRKNSWFSVNDEIPPQDEEVIALSENGHISFAHIVDKTKAKDYDGWNIPSVAFWMPFEMNEEMKVFYD